MKKRDIQIPPSHPSRFHSSNDHDTINKSDEGIDDDTDRPCTFDLNKVMHQFGDNVQLLELILSSKLEEDRRRTEEAKLKSKQLDYLIQVKKEEQSNLPSYHHQQQEQRQPDASPSDSDSDLTPFHSNQPRHRSNTTTYTPEGTSNHFDPRQDDLTRQHERHLQPLTSHFPPTSLSTPLPSIDSIDRPLSSSFFTSSSSTTPPAFTFPRPESSSHTYFQHHQRSISNPPIDDPPPKLPIPPSPGQEASLPQNFKRRRREMQSITMIIETKEHPYNDSYHWKNNGNTVHKKTGQRSIYYKCSNAIKGCHVNKTVTFKGQGEYLIKYRGKHLEDCLVQSAE